MTGGITRENASMIVGAAYGLAQAGRVIPIGDLFAYLRDRRIEALAAGDAAEAEMLQADMVTVDTLETFLLAAERATEVGRRNTVATVQAAREAAQQAGIPDDWKT